MSDYPIHVDPSGVPRLLNLRPSPPLFKASLPSGIIIPASEIQDFYAIPSQATIKDQGQEGACVGHGGARTGECVRLTAGMTHVPLSAWYIYSILCNGDDVGASIFDALTLSSTDGIAPESLVPYGLINPKLLSQAAHTAAPRFRVEIGESLTSWEEIISAGALGKFLNISICVGNKFSNLDSEGVPPVTRGAANHAVCVGGGIKTSSKWGQLILMANSWGADWGQAGFCWLSRAHVDNATYFEGYSVTAVFDDPQDPTNPPNIA